MPEGVGVMESASGSPLVSSSPPTTHLSNMENPVMMWQPDNYQRSLFVVIGPTSTVSPHHQQLPPPATNIIVVGNKYYTCK